MQSLERFRTKYLLAGFVLVIFVFSSILVAIWLNSELNKPKTQITVRAEVKEDEWRECRLYLVRLKLEVHPGEGERVFIARITTFIVNTNVSWTKSLNITVTVSYSEEFTAVLHPEVGVIYSERCEIFEIQAEVEAIILYEQFGALKQKGYHVSLEYGPIKVRICGSG